MAEPVRRALVPAVGVSGMSSAVPLVPRVGFIGPRQLLPCALFVGVIFLAAVCWAAQPSWAAPAAASTLPWWMLAPAFAAAEGITLPLPRPARVSLVALPLVIGLFCSSSTDLIEARLAGLLLFLIIRPLLLRNRGGTSRFTASIVVGRLAAAVLDVPLALLLFRAVVPHRADNEHLAWLAALVAAVGVVTVGLATDAGFAPDAGRVRGRQALETLGYSLAGGVVAATFGIVCADLRSRDPSSIGLLAAGGAVLLVWHGANVSSRANFQALTDLHHLSATLGVAGDAEQVMRALLTRTMELVGGDAAELVVSLGPGAGVLHLREPMSPDHETVSFPTSITAEGPVRLREDSGAHARQLLAARGWRDAMHIPFRGDAQVTGALIVAHDLGTRWAGRTFGAQQLRMAEEATTGLASALRAGELAAQLGWDSRHDAVTGLLNRTAIRDALLEYADNTAATSAGSMTGGPAGGPPDGPPDSAPDGPPDSLAGQPGWSVLVMDLDGFREVNATLGHQRGDELLREIGVRIVGSVPADALVARVGADEFCVVLPGVSDERVGLEAGRAILRGLERPVRLGDEQLEIGGSIGLAVAPQHGTDASLLLRRADVAMQSARGTADGTRAYDPSQESNNPARLRLISDLRVALERQHLAVWLQPQLDLRSGEVVGAEALVRWFRPGVGYVNPEQFVPIAERSGLIRPLTSVVLDQAIAFAASHQDPKRPFAVSVNISVRSLIDPDLVSLVNQMLTKHGLPAAQLTLEITESSVMADPERTLSTLEELHDLGVRLSIDDFGTGHASLAYIQRLPVDEIKIDKSFVKSMLTTPADRAIVTSIVQLATGLGLDAVAEGAELPAHLAELRKIGCPRAQGYGIGRPMSLVAFDAWLSERKSPVMAS